MDEPKNVGAQVTARVGARDQTFIRYSDDTAFEPWINMEGDVFSWNELRDPKPVNSDSPELANLYFQMGLACGDLIRQNKDSMPLDMVYRIMGGETYEQVSGVVLP